MNAFEIIIINLIFIIFPLSLWLLYQVYSKALNLKKSEVLLDLALICSIYLIVKFGKLFTLPILCLNIPLVLAYFKDKNFSITIISILIVTYYNYYFDFNIIVLILEYSLYFLIYLVVKTKNIKFSTFLNLFLIIKFLMMFLKMIIDKNFIENINYNIYEIIFIFISFYLVAKAIIYLFSLSEEIVETHIKFCEIEREKDITNSLFQITHEIKNPIAVCKGYLDMFDVNNKEHSKKYIPIIKEEIDRLLLLLQDFLSINKIKIDKEIIDANLLLEDMVKTFHPIFGRRNIKTDFRINYDEVYIDADYNRLTQVLINLIKNSMEAIPQDRNGMISLYLKKRSDCIKIYVEDNGEGISKENMKKLKSPFFTTKPRGTGLGVYLCNEIIKAHKGEIKYFNRKEGGTKVEIKLPYNKKDIKNFS